MCTHWAKALTAAMAEIAAALTKERRRLEALDRPRSLLYPRLSKKEKEVLLPGGSRKCQLRKDLLDQCCCDRELLLWERERVARHQERRKVNQRLELAVCKVW